MNSGRSMYPDLSSTCHLNLKTLDSKFIKLYLNLSYSSAVFKMRGSVLLLFIFYFLLFVIDWNCHMNCFQNYKLQIQVQLLFKQGKIQVNCPRTVKSSHLCLYSVFNNTNCNQETAQYQNRKIVCQ